MTPDELTQYIQNEVTNEFPDWQPGQEQVWPTAYFDNGVFFTMPGGEIQPRNPSYCATNDGAAAIANVLTDSGRGLICSTGETDWALPGVADNRQVPYLRFKTDKDKAEGPFTGVLVNAGSLLAYFDHGWPGIRALNSCQLDIERARLAAANALDPNQPPDLTEQQVQEIMAQTS